MEKNVGKADKLIRVLISLILVGFYFSGMIHGIVGYILLAVAGVLMLTGLVNFCPLYAIMKVDTCKRR